MLTVNSDYTPCPGKKEATVF